MGYTVKVFDTRYSPVAEYVRMDQQTATTQVWTTMDYPSDWVAATVANSSGANAGVPRVFAVNGGAEGADGNVVQLDAAGVFKDTPASGAAAVNIDAQWVSKQFDMSSQYRSMAGRDKRVHLWGCKVRNPVTAGTSPTTALATSIYTSGSPTVTTATAAQSLTSALSPTSTGNDWGTNPQSGNDVTVVRTEGVEQLRSELFQMVIDCNDSVSDFRLVSAEIYWTQAG